MTQGKSQTLSFDWDEYEYRVGPMPYALINTLPVLIGDGVT